MTTRSYKRLAVLALALLVAAPGAALAAAGPRRITGAVQATKSDVAPTRTYSSPFVLVHPEDRLTVVASTVDMRSRTCGLLRSKDGGRTWRKLDAIPSPPSYPFCFHTSGAVTQTALAFGGGNTLYYAMSGWDTQDGGPGRNVSILLARSTNLGDSWSTTVVRDARGKQGADQERDIITSLAVDAKNGTDDVVYVGFRTNYPGAQPVGADAVRPSYPMVAVSTDGGRTFSAPVSATGDYFESPAVRAEALRLAPPPSPTTTAASTTGQTTPPTTPGGQPAGTTPPASAPRAPRDAPGNFGGGNPDFAVDGNGNLYVLWVRSTANISPSPDQPMYISRSTDRGKTFSVVTEVSPPNRSYGGQILQWSPKGGPEGSLHALYQVKTGPNLVDDIGYRRSTDGGKTWTDQKLLHDDDPGRQVAQFLPNLAVAPGGRLDAVWWDFRNDPGTYVNDVYYASSTDNGTTWSRNVRVTDRSINRKIGPWSNNFDMRQPPGISSTDAFAVVAWDDTRNGDPVGQAQDVYSAAIQYAPVSTGVSPALKYLLAGVVGLLAVGLVLFAITAANRRRTGGPPPAPESISDREPAGVR